MGDMLSSATSGLLAFQRALDTTSHNIANVNTDGYSRQRVQIGTRMPEAFPTGFVGSGADVQTIERLYDEFLGVQARNASSTYSRLDLYAAQSDQINNLFSDSETGLTASLQKFINAFHDVANSPSSIPARQVVLGQAQSFVDRLHSYDSRLAAIGDGINSQMDDEAKAITDLAANIAELNERIQVDGARMGQPPNDLLDQRTHLLDELAKHVNVKVANQSDGSLVVSIGNGQPLVVGSQAARLAAAPDPYDATRQVITVQSLGIPVDITTRLSGGTLGAKLDFQREQLDPVRNALGRIAVAVTEVANQQHRAGIDLNGAFGQDLFTVGNATTFARSSNGGTSSLTVTRQQPSAGAITTYDYVLDYVGASWILRRADNGATVSMTGAGTIASPFQADGLSIVVSGAAVSGDSHLIRPNMNAVSGLKLNVTDPTQLAAAAPIATVASNNNIGTGSISAGQVLNVSNPQLLNTVTIQFTNANTYTINAGPPQAYTPGANIDVNGWRVQISGSPGANDVFTVRQNNNPAGDNRNALLVADALGRPVLDGGTQTLNASGSSLVSAVGVTTSQLHSNRDAQLSILNDSVTARDSISGVNLDEEAAQLIRYQQAYQAAAQVIAIAGTLFDTVLAATRR